MPFDDDGEECDFCDLTLEEGESFTDVRLGPLPQADKIRVTETGKPKRKARGKKAQALLLMETLNEHPSFEVDGTNAVEEVRSTGHERDVTWTKAGEHGSVPPVDTPQFVTERKPDMVGVGLMVFPETIESEPDARLCPRCKDLFE